MRGFGKQVRDQLAANGCRYIRHGKGDHDVWESPHNGRRFTVPVNVDSRHTANKIMKDAGLRKAF